MVPGVTCSGNFGQQTSGWTADFSLFLLLRKKKKKKRKKERKEQSTTHEKHSCEIHENIRYVFRNFAKRLWNFSTRRLSTPWNFRISRAARYFRAAFVKIVENAKSSSDYYAGTMKQFSLIQWIDERRRVNRYADEPVFALCSKKIFISVLFASIKLFERKEIILCQRESRRFSPFFF